MTVLKESIEKIPGKVPALADACGVSPRAVYKWLKTGRLPRTDYTGETQYSKVISELTGGSVDASWLLESTKQSSS